MVRQPPAKWAPLLLVLLAAVLGALPPLHEMDLAQHLATGEWIARHRAVPFTEPFAWTREGQPYFAYSWVAQLLFFGLLDTFGPFALHVLEGMLVGGAAAAALWAGRMLGWRLSVRLVVAALHLALMWGVAPTLRPQQFLFITLPLAWGTAAQIRARGPSVARIIAVIATGALAVNTHIFFPLTAIPFVYYLLTDVRTRGMIIGAAAIVGGWLLTPYLLAMPQVFALNFGHNALLSRPTSVAEFVPGFEYAMPRTGVIFAVLALLAAPWLLPPAGTRRERVTRAVFWIAGLAMFAYAGRLAVAWWTLALPLVGLTVDRALHSAGDVLRRPVGRFAAIAGAAIMLMVSAPQISPVFWLFEGDTTRRLLPRAGEDPALWLPSWLLCNTRPDAHGRVYTEFNYGSELNWRLPGYSPSIDGRTIFPDSDAIEFGFDQRGRLYRHATTWKYADLALLDRSYWLAPVLDRDSAWVLLAQGKPTSRGGMGALWAKRAWWQQNGTATQIPALDIRTADPRGMCAATGFR